MTLIIVGMVFCIDGPVAFGEVEETLKLMDHVRREFSFHVKSQYSDGDTFYQSTASSQIDLFVYGDYRDDERDEIAEIVRAKTVDLSIKKMISLHFYPVELKRENLSALWRIRNGKLLKKN